ncbi:SDR family NAD(P)-dependent oxidoreductase [Vibrio sp. S4M6]|uniref:SDR family NAD(P)-dependent oxidoreductase n=1 Tax=Vibrio sinus TaxID=2946865 RepID=UPI002029E784|nr:SDR family NAD(P)-dependent oxidoreductase [Vibrio sinus]MCL9782425.1 SDR family NAD(P)-dependent oxidoreductase [Vibrio sinus]
MSKVVLITGATDGIGLETAKMLLDKEIYVLLHGRSESKMEKIKAQLSDIYGAQKFETYLADLSCLTQVKQLILDICEKHGKLDVLINNAGVFTTNHYMTDDGLDIRFAVNTIAPYLLTKELLPLFVKDGRVINVSSAAQASVNIEALLGEQRLSDGDAYAQSKLALTMWTREMAKSLGERAPMIVSVNPASFLGSKMVQTAYGVAGKDLRIGAIILCRAALSDEFIDAAGKYFDNDTGRFDNPHPDALDGEKSALVVKTIEDILAISLINTPNFLANNSQSTIDADLYFK